jgi:chemotaxis protein CheX
MKQTLLIIEPDEDVRQQLAVELSDLTQMLVIQARDGLQAYQKTRNQAFNIILTEFNTSKLSGTELIAAIRETDHNPNTPFIVYSENIEDAKNKTRGTKHIEFIKKPAEYSEISEKIKTLAKKNLEKKTFKIDVDFINPFIDSSVKTLNSMCSVKTIDARRPYLLSDDEVLDIDISGTLSISSPYFKGSIAISFSNSVYKNLVSSMLEEGQESITVDNQDGAAEMINIIFGQTKAVLNTRGYKLQRAIPNVVRGPGHKIYPNSKVPVLLVPFTSDAGNFFIQICVKAI